MEQSIIQMKIQLFLQNYMTKNFIRDLSDDLFRQNFQLKNELILSKQQLKGNHRLIQDYQVKLIQMIKIIDPSVLMLGTPEQTLTYFIKSIQQKLADYSKISDKASQNQKYIEILTIKMRLVEQKLQSRQSQLKKKQVKINQLQQLIVNIESRSSYQIYQLKKHKQQLQQTLANVKKLYLNELSDLDNKKRAEIISIKKKAYDEFVQFRDQSQKEIISLQKQLKREIDGKNKNIKHLQGILQKITIKEPLDNHQNNFLVQYLKGFQEHNKIQQIVSILREENMNAKHKNKENQKKIFALQSQSQQMKYRQQNLENLMNKMRVQKSQLEKQNKKYQKDHQALQLYYNTKWNDELKNVKANMQKNFKHKSDSLQEEFNCKYQEIYKQMIHYKQQMQTSQKRNSDFVRQISQLNKKNAHSQNNIKLIQLKMKQITLRSQQSWQMSRQELIRLKADYQERQNSLKFQIKRLNASIQSINFRILQNQSINNEKQRKFYEEKQLLIDILSLQHKKDKQLLSIEHQQNTKKLLKIIAQNDKRTETIRSQIQLQYQQKQKAIKKQIQREIKHILTQKDDQLQKMNNKYKEVQLKLKALKKKGQQDIEQYSNKCFQLYRSIEEQQHKIQKLKVELTKEIKLKNEAFIQNNSYQAEIQKLMRIIQEHQNIQEQLHTNIHKLQSNVQILQQKQSKWQDNLNSIKKELNNEFQLLKNIHQAQANIAKSKIWQLQEMIRKRPTKKKDLQKIHALSKQKSQLKNQLCIKEAENIILNQVKDYYQIKCRQRQYQTQLKSQEIKKQKFFFSRKKTFAIKKNKQKSKTQLNESQEVIEFKKYIQKSQKKNILVNDNKFRATTGINRLNTTLS